MTYRYHDILASFRETMYQLLGWASPIDVNSGVIRMVAFNKKRGEKQQQRGCYGSSMIQKYWFGNKPDFTKTRSTVCHFRQRNYIEYWDFQATKRFMFHLLAKRVIFSARNEWKVAGSWEMPCMSPVLWMAGKSSISSWFVMVYPCLSSYNPIRIYSIVTYSYQLVVQACPQYVLASLSSSLAGVQEGQGGPEDRQRFHICGLFEFSQQDAGRPAQGRGGDTERMEDDWISCGKYAKTNRYQ